MTRTRIDLGIVFLLLGAGWVHGADGGEQTEGVQPKKHPYRAGQVRLGAFLVTNIDTSISVSPAGAPLGAAINVTQDLGLPDSQNVPRLMLSYRFSRRHRIDFGYYGFRSDGFTRLLDWLDFKHESYPPGTEIESFANTDIYKLAYTWVFHDDGKVLLGLSGGLFVTRFDIGLSADGPVVYRNESERLTAPLPVLGARIGYNVGRKLRLLAAGDWFLINYDAYRGQSTDAFLLVEHRTSKHVGFGGGVNAFSLTVDIDDSDKHADIRHVYSGWVAYLAFYF